MENSKQLTKIINSCKKGSNNGFEKLVDMYAGRIYGYFFRLTGNKEVSDDLLSEFFLKIVSGIKKFKDGSFKSWIFKIASNVFYDFLRDKQKQQKIIEEQSKNLSQPVENRHQDNDKSWYLQKQLEKIDAETRELLVMRYYSEMSFKEIAAIRNEPIGTTLSKVHRGLEKLRQLMRKKND